MNGTIPVRICQIQTAISALAQLLNKDKTDSWTPSRLFAAGLVLYVYIYCAVFNFPTLSMTIVFKKKKYWTVLGNKMIPLSSRFANLWSQIEVVGRGGETQLEEGEHLNS